MGISTFETTPPVGVVDRDFPYRAPARDPSGLLIATRAHPGARANFIAIDWF